MTGDDVNDIREYYNNQVEGEGNRLARHQLERDITLLYLADFLPPGGKVLEVGAATGAYTLWLAERGHFVIAVDLSAGLLKICQERLAQAGLQSRVDCRLADARDLSVVAEKDFDAALLMGPLYHLVLLEDRQRAIQQVHQRLKPGGLIFSSFISRYGILGDLMKNVPGWIEDQAEVRSIIERGRDPADYHKGIFRGYFSTAEEIAPLHESLGFKTVVVAGVEPAISADDESYNSLQGEQRKLWQDLLYALSRELSLVASSRHMLYIGRKA